MRMCFEPFDGEFHSRGLRRTGTAVLFFRPQRRAPLKFVTRLLPKDCHLVMSRPILNFDRDRVLSLSDEDLLTECRVDRTRGSGRGGQKRNVTDSAVRLTHLPTGLQAMSDATRSQARNRQSALRRLRRVIALDCRLPPPAEWPYPVLPGKRDARYVRWLACILDLLEAFGYRVSDAAESIGISTGRFVRMLAGDAGLWQRVNKERRERDLPPLRKSH